MAFAVRSTASVSMAKSFAKTSNARLSVVSRASEQEPPTPAPSPAPSTTESAPEEVVKEARHEAQKHNSVTVNTAPEPLGTVGGLMKSAPEIINGRLAMLGFVAALGAELSSGQSVLRQIGDEPTLISLTFLLFIVASLVPINESKKPEAFGPFTPNAELINGRAAMIGFASMLAFEVFNGAAMF
eukprot:gene25049-biopygen19499